MKSALAILVIGLVSVQSAVPVHGEARFEPPGERQHLGFVLARGPSGEPQAVMPGYTRDQAVLEGEMAAEFKGTRWWWLSGYVCGFSFVGLFVCDGYTPSSGSVSKKEYESIRERGVEYVQGYREGHGRHLRKRRAESRDDGFFWGLVSLLGVVAVKGTLAFVD